MDNTQLSKTTYKYKLISKIKVFIGILIFLMGLLFCLSFFADGNLPNNQFFGDNHSQKNLLISFIITPVCIISLLGCLFYFYQYFTSIEVTNMEVIKKRPLSFPIKIKLDSISDVKLLKFLLLCFVFSKDGGFIVVFPSIENYENLIKSIH